MKKSNILIFLPVLLILTGLIFYNFKLKELYDTKEYKSRYRDMVFTPISGIDELTLDFSVNPMSVNAEYGEKEGIWILKSIKSKIKTDIHGHHLTLGWLPDQNKQNQYNSNGVIIITKKLRSIVTIDDPTRSTYNGGVSQISISNYKLDQLGLKLSPNISMMFSNMQINTFNAVIGNENQKGGQLAIDSLSKINTAHFNIPGDGILITQGVEIKNVTYNVSDDARVMLSGKDLNVIKK